MRVLKSVLLFGVISLSWPVFAGQVEFLHWWTSKGEMNAVSEIDSSLREKGLLLLNAPIPGGGGDSARAILQARTISGNPPHMALLQGPTISSWAALGLLMPLTVQDELPGLPSFIDEIHRFQEARVALPVTLHRLNWVWVNSRVLGDGGIMVPDSWDGIASALEALSEKGQPGLAIGNDPWQSAQLFENIAFGLGGAEYYRRLFIDLDIQALLSDTTRNALSLYRRIGQTVGQPESKAWDEASAGLRAGQYAMQFGGDWVAGELLDESGKLPEDIECLAAPAIQPGFIYNIDSLALMRTRSISVQDAQQLVETLSTSRFLQDFNRVKGSIPVYSDIPLTGFNRCAIQSRRDFDAAVDFGTAVPSFSDSMAINPIIRNAMLNELHQYFTDPLVTDEQVLNNLVKISQSSKVF
ncbi:ABC transporter substrate-binding protein [Parasalinivibrio latis]|uniref:ABC transporter substrate-binding protein n=1 Tax=Parasalinivibrio latis TaxID=2952610 RepID=UPI0030E0F7CC